MKRYLMTVLVMFDQFCNAATGGYADETISRRLAIEAAQGKWFGCVFCDLIQIIVPGHCDLSKPTKGAEYGRPNDV